MRILVTGATGYIGSELIKKLENKGYALIVLTRDTSSVNQFLDKNCKVVQFHDYEEILDIFRCENIHGVIHLASKVVVEHTPENIDNMIQSNITYGTFLLEACKESNVKWFINTGTFWQNFENKDYSPVNLYAATKEAFESISQYYTETSDLIFTTLKLNDTFGPNDKRPKIFNLWSKIAQTGEVLNMSSGKQIIDICYIEDVLNAYELLINHLKSDYAFQFKNKTFVVKSDERMSLKEMSIVFEKATDTSLNINWGGKEHRKREVMLPWEYGNVVPGWKQKYSLKEAIIKTIKKG